MNECTIPASGEGRPDLDALEAAIARLPKPTGKFSDLIDKDLLIRFEAEDQLQDDGSNIKRQDKVVEDDFTTPDPRTGLSFEEVMPDDPPPNQSQHDARIERTMVPLVREIPEAQRRVLVLKAVAPGREPSFRAVSNQLGKSEAYAGRMWREALTNLGKRLVERYAPGRQYIRPARCPRRSPSCRGGDCPHSRPLHARPGEKPYPGARRLSTFDRIGLYPPSEWWWRDRIQYKEAQSGPVRPRKLTRAQVRELPSRRPPRDSDEAQDDFKAIRKWYGNGPYRGACGIDEHGVLRGMNHPAPTFGGDGVAISDLTPRTRQMLAKLLEGSAGELADDEASPSEG